MARNMIYRTPPKHVKVLKTKFCFTLDATSPPASRYVQDELKGYARFDPVFNRAGFYYDRYLDFAWYEDGKGNAFTKSRLQVSFKDKLDKLNSRQLSIKEKEAILILVNAGICPHSLYSQYSNQFQDKFANSLKLRVNREDHRKKLHLASIRQKSPFKLSNPND